MPCADLGARIMSMKARSAAGTCRWERAAAKKLTAEYFQRFPKERYQTEVESWRRLQSQNIEFTMKRLREPIEGCG